MPRERPNLEIDRESEREILTRAGRVWDTLTPSLPGVTHERIQSILGFSTQEADDVLGFLTRAGMLEMRVFQKKKWLHDQVRGFVPTAYFLRPDNTARSWQEIEYLLARDRSNVANILKAKRDAAIQKSVIDRRAREEYLATSTARKAEEVSIEERAPEKTEKELEADLSSEETRDRVVEKQGPIKPTQENEPQEKISLFKEKIQTPDYFGEIWDRVIRHHGSRISAYKLELEGFSNREAELILARMVALDIIELRRDAKEKAVQDRPIIKGDESRSYEYVIKEQFRGKAWSELYGPKPEPKRVERETVLEKQKPREKGKFLGRIMTFLKVALGARGGAQPAMEAALVPPPNPPSPHMIESVAKEEALILPVTERESVEKQPEAIPLDIEEAAPTTPFSTERSFTRGEESEPITEIPVVEKEPLDNKEAKKEEHGASSEEFRRFVEERMVQKEEARREEHAELAQLLHTHSLGSLRQAAMKLKRLERKSNEEGFDYLQGFAYDKSYTDGVEDAGEQLSDKRIVLESKKDVRRVVEEINFLAAVEINTLIRKELVRFSKMRGTVSSEKIRESVEPLLDPKALGISSAHKAGIARFLSRILRTTLKELFTENKAPVVQKALEELLTERGFTIKKGASKRSTATK